MLKITSAAIGKLVILELEGKLSGPWVEELATCWRKTAESGGIIRVMLCGVTFIDDKGRELLTEMYRERAELVAEGCMNKAVVEEIVRGAQR